MRVELLCEIFIHTKELPILVSLHYDMDSYIGIDVKIVKYYYLKRHEGNQSLYYLMQHMYKHEIQKSKKLDDKNVLYNSAHIMQLTQLIISYHATMKRT